MWDPSQHISIKKEIEETVPVENESNQDNGILRY